MILIWNSIKSSPDVGRVDVIVFFLHIPVNKLIFDTKTQTKSRYFFYETAKIRWLKFYNFPKIEKLKCREIWPLQICEIKVSRKFHVIR